MNTQTDIQPKKRSLLRLPEWTQRLSLPLAFASYLLLDTALRYLFDGVGVVPAASAPPWIFSVAWSVLLTAVAALLPRLWQRLWLGVSFLVFGVEYVAHAALYQLTGTFFSFATLAYAEDGAKFFSFAYLNILLAAWVWLAVSFVLMVLAIVFASKKRLPAKLLLLPALVISGCVLVIMLEQRSLYIDVTRDYLTWNAEEKENVFAESYSRIDRTNDCFSVTGLYEFTYRSATSVLFPTNFVSKEEHVALDEYYDAHPKKTDSPYAGALKGQNLIMILMESVDSWMVTPEYMPNLCGLMRESVTFPNYYAPMYIAAATFNSEFAANTGLAAPPVGVSNEAYTSYSFPFSAAHLFRDAGYTANSFHIGNPAVYNRGNVHKNFGYETYNSALNMGVDNVFLDTQLVRAHARYSPSRPFFSFLLTYSVHGPHNGEMWGAVEPHFAEAHEAIDFDAMEFPNGLDRDEYTYAIAQAMETDAFIGDFMEQLRADGRAEDTTVIFLADHYAKYMTDTEFVMGLKGVPNRDFLTNVPFGIWSEKLEPQVIDKAVSLLDVMPTIASLFDLDVDLRYYLGSDMFDSGKGLVNFVDGHWYDGEVYYDGGGYYTVTRPGTEDEEAETTSKSGTKAKTPEEPAEEITTLTRIHSASDEMRQQTTAASQRINTAWRTFQSNYFAYLVQKKTS